MAEKGTQCSLCGWVVDADEMTIHQQAPPAATKAKPVFCNACGWKNPPQSRFCSQCGGALQVLESASAAPKAILPSVPPAASSPKSPAPAKAVGTVAGIAALLVVALFMVTAVSKQTHPTAPQDAPITPSLSAEALTGTVAEQIAALDAQIESDTGLVRLTLQREKAFALVQADRLDLAAMEYEKVAEVSGAPEDWRITGDLFYDWMSHEQDAGRRAQIAGSAVSAYENVLALEPDNLGVRTDLATAYLNTGSPMQGVTEIKRVLAADSTHLDANFNYGLMLWRIGRMEQAAAQFELVMELAENPSEHYARASDALRTMEQGADGL